MKSYIHLISRASLEDVAIKPRCPNLGFIAIQKAAAAGEARCVCIRSSRQRRVGCFGGCTGASGRDEKGTVKP